MASGDTLYILAVFFVHSVQIFQKSLQNPPAPRVLPHFGILQNMPRCKILSFFVAGAKIFFRAGAGGVPVGFRPAGTAKNHPAVVHSRVVLF